MADYKRKTQSDNKHLSNLTSARYRHVEASQTDVVVREGAGRLIRVVLNTNGGVVVIKDGDAIVASIAADAPETSIEYGIYCNTSIEVTTGATCDVTVVFDD